MADRETAHARGAYSERCEEHSHWGWVDASMGRVQSLRCLRQCDRGNAGVQLGGDYRDMYLLLVLNGLRIGEYWNLRAKDIDLRNMQFTVTGKTGSRTLPITSVTKPIFERRLNAIESSSDSIARFTCHKRAIAHVKKTVEC